MAKGKSTTKSTTKKATKKRATTKSAEKVGAKLNEKQIAFVHNWLGIGEEGCLYNATKAYSEAYSLPYASHRTEVYTEHMDEEGNTQKVRTWTVDKNYSTCRSNGSKLLTNTNIQRYIRELVKKVDPEHEIGKLAQQNDDLSIKLRSNETLAKIAGKLKDNTVNIPEIEKLADAIKKVAK